MSMAFFPHFECHNINQPEMCFVHNGNKYGSVPLTHPTSLVGKYDKTKQVLEKNTYDEHEWPI